MEGTSGKFASFIDKNCTFIKYIPGDAENCCKYTFRIIFEIIQKQDNKQVDGARETNDFFRWIDQG